MTLTACPTPEVLKLYLLGRIADPMVPVVESHLSSCALCQGRTEELENVADSFVALLHKPPEDETKTGTPPPLPPSTAVTDRQDPERVAGREIVRKLASGGLGVAYLARHVGLNREEAVKLILPKYREDSGLLTRFKREQWAIARMKDKQHVVEVFDAGADADTGPHLVMECLDGDSLNTILQKHGPLSVGEACELIRQAALGLQVAHDVGLVHRDVKPSNLMLARFGDRLAVKVIDWGLVKATSESDSLALDATSTGALLGTPDYMPPEQAAPDPNTPIGPAADVYSLGCTLFTLLNGKPPFHHRPLLGKLTGHASVAFPPVNRPNLPVEVISLMQEMVDKNPARRPSARAVAERLKPFGSDSSRLRALLDAQALEPTITYLPPRRRSRRWLTAAAAFVVLLLAGLVLRITTARGKLTVTFTEAIPNNLEVLVDGNRVQFDRVDGDKAVVTVDVGEREIVVRADGKELRGPEKVSVPRFGKAPAFVVTVEPPIASKLVTPGARPVLGDGPEKPVGMSGNPSGTTSTALAFTVDGKQCVSIASHIIFFDLLKRSKSDDKIQAGGGSWVVASPDGTVLVAFNSNVGATFFDPITHKVIGAPLSLYGMTGAFAYSPDSTLMAIGVGADVRIFEVRSKKEKCKFQLGNAVNSVAFSPDGKFLVTGGNEKTIRLWNLEKERQEREFNGHEGAVFEVGYSADGKHIYSVSKRDHTLRVWDAATDKELQKISLVALHDGIYRSVAFWPSGRALTGHADGNLILWDLEKGKEIWRFTHKGEQITAVAISRDGYHALASSNTDGLVYLHRLPAPISALRANPGPGLADEKPKKP